MVVVSGKAVMRQLLFLWRLFPAAALRLALVWRCLKFLCLASSCSFTFVFFSLIQCEPKMPGKPIGSQAALLNVSDFG